METKFLRQFENLKVSLGLKNNFVYSGIIFSITPGGLLEFADRQNNIISVEPEFVCMVSKINKKGDEKNEN